MHVFPSCSGDLAARRPAVPSVRKGETTMTLDLESFLRRIRRNFDLNRGQVGWEGPLFPS